MQPFAAGCHCFPATGAMVRPQAKVTVGTRRCAEVEGAPDADGLASLSCRDGHVCRYCGNLVIDEKVISFLHRHYAEAVPSTGADRERNAAIIAMRISFEHVVPHSRGGDNTIENIIVSCSPCNSAKSDWTLEQVGLIDPRTVPVERSSWDGLVRILGRVPPEPVLR